MKRTPPVYSLLARLLLRGARASFLRDGLEEEYARRLAHDGAGEARAWYRRQLLSAVRAWWRPDSVRARRQLRSVARRARTRLPTSAPSTDPPGSRFMERLLQDLRFGLRNLISEPTFALLAIGALALGTGGTTAIFTVLDTVFLRPLPYPEADRIMTVWETNGDWLHNSVTPANFLDWRERSESFSALAALASGSFNLEAPDEPLRLSGYRVTGEFHQVLGVAPHLGRAIEPGDDRFGAPPVAILGHGLWARVFGSDPDVVGRQVRIGGVQAEIVGVMPAGFAYPSSGVELWMPMSWSPEEAAVRGFRSLQVIGRLADSATPESASQELVRIAAALREEFPDVNGEVSANVIPLREEWLGRVQTTLVAMAAAVGVLLLVACANVANLLLARAVGRRDEIALRSALGAGPGRIAQQALTEAALLGGLGASAGMMLALPGARFLRSLVPAHVPLAERVAVDGRAALFAVLLALGTALVFGLAPALRAMRLEQASALRGARSDGSAGGFRRALIVVQVALAVVLLVGAGLLVRSFAQVVGQDLGYRPESVLRARVDLAGERYEAEEQRTRFYTELVEGARRLPGATQAAMITRVPLGMQGGALIYTPWEQPTPPRDATFRVVTAGYFEALGIELRGRDFGASESEPVVIVSERLAREHWPTEEPIGQRLKIGDEDSDAPWRRVVGVAADIRQWNLELEPRGALYVPVGQVAPGYFAPRDLVVRAAGDPALLAGALRQLVRELDPELPVSGVMRLEELVRRASASRRFQMSLLAAFAVLAATIAMIGLYGVVSYSVQAERRHLGIRLALGAARGRILGFVLRRGGVLVGTGLVLGMAAAAGATRVVRGLLYGVGAFDPVTFLAVPAALALVALLALLLPARRASRIDPTQVLRGS